MEHFKDKETGIIATREEWVHAWNEFWAEIRGDIDYKWDTHLIKQPEPKK